MIGEGDLVGEREEALDEAAVVEIEGAAVVEIEGAFVVGAANLDPLPARSWKTGSLKLPPVIATSL